MPRGTLRETHLGPFRIELLRLLRGVLDTWTLHQVPDLLPPAEGLGSMPVFHPHLTLSIVYSQTSPHRLSTLGVPVSLLPVSRVQGLAVWKGLVQTVEAFEKTTLPLTSTALNVLPKALLPDGLRSIVKKTLGVLRTQRTLGLEVPVLRVQQTVCGHWVPSGRVKLDLIPQSYDGQPAQAH